MSRKGVTSRLPRLNRRTIIILAIIVIIIVLIIAGLKFFEGDAKVNFNVLSEAEIPQQITSQVIPEYRSLERALACVVDDKVYVMVSRGEKPTSGYEIAIEKMMLSEENDLTTLSVYTEFKDPQPGTALTQVLTYPLQIAETDLTNLPDQIELKVQYVE
ncbi:MAG: protease complex subunit PrcB family protein [Anaerovoracaceae bacterium]